MRKIREVIIVEGRYDKNTLSQAVDATIIETNGFGIFSDRERLELLRRLAEARGVIILTDSDGAGLVIRNFLKGAIAPEKIKNAYIPELFGKEKRKSSPSREGKLGVEGMNREVLVNALIRAGATIEDEVTLEERGAPITKADMFAAGLSGQPESAERRAALLKWLGMPTQLSPNALLDVLNVIMTREDFFKYAAK